MREVAPKITDKLIATLAQLGYGKPEIVPAIPRYGAAQSQCWLNVVAAIQAEEGTLISGRTVWKQVDGLWIQLEAHAVWEKADGTIVDPTPKMDGETEIVFVREPLEFQGYLIPPIYHVQSKQKPVKNFIELTTKLNEIRATIPSGENRPATQDEKILMGALGMLTMELFPNAMSEMMRPVTVNLNPCGD